MNAAVMLKEIQRVLKTGGVYIAISYGNPSSRFIHLVFFSKQKRSHLNFDVDCLVLKTNKLMESHDLDLKDSEHFCYICVKKNGAQKKFDANWATVKKEIQEEQVFDDEDTVDGVYEEMDEELDSIDL